MEVVSPHPSTRQACRGSGLGPRPRTPRDVRVVLQPRPAPYRAVCLPADVGTRKNHGTAPFLPLAPIAEADDVVVLGLSRVRFKPEQAGFESVPSVRVLRGIPLLDRKLLGRVVQQHPLRACAQRVVERSPSTVAALDTVQPRGTDILRVPNPRGRARLLRLVAIPELREEEWHDPVRVVWATQRAHAYLRRCIALRAQRLQPVRYG